MMRNKATPVLALLCMLALPACMGADGTESAGDDAAGDELAAGAETQQLACTPVDRVPLEGRVSPYDSLTVPVGDSEAKLCYGRPSLRGRTMIGGDAVPYGQLWRTGANEPTIIHLPVAAEIAGMRAEPGSYSIYTIPGTEEWVVILNRSTSQWGHEGQYTDEVRAQEVGRATVASQQLDEPIELFTIRAEPDSGGATRLLLEWQNSRVIIPVRPAA
ncbi:MAG: DUF2911 domain-containing protein [Longimicrobiales bacterium]